MKTQYGRDRERRNEGRMNKAWEGKEGESVDQKDIHEKETGRRKEDSVEN